MSYIINNDPFDEGIHKLLMPERDDLLVRTADDTRGLNPYFTSNFQLFNSPYISTLIQVMDLQQVWFRVIEGASVEVGVLVLWEFDVVMAYIGAVAIVL